ncbi:hypothetical protein GMRT_14229 [Giardia muris]|uniref:Uncharacterized protein n=1 Tax=Giardia muris TaxID=5742 RepID=A0A4Z1SWP0_GIAMU|nr:hypothetical protein GMRT_14229 [Giardia muris]|eukprot:TNJ30232.1 hypothetical protein GMRT_14229 [Giardia muris]
MVEGRRYTELAMAFMKYFYDSIAINPLELQEALPSPCTYTYRICDAKGESQYQTKSDPVSIVQEMCTIFQNIEKVTIQMYSIVPMDEGFLLHVTAKWDAKTEPFMTSDTVIVRKLKGTGPPSLTVQSITSHLMPIAG